MIGRCYDVNHSKHSSYGGCGVTVSDELLNFNDYINVVSKLEHYQDLINEPEHWQIDKDLKSDRNCKVYSENTLTIIPTQENIALSNQEDMKAVLMYNDENLLLATFPSRCRAAMVMELERGNISRAIRNRCKYGGYYWRDE